MKTTEQVLNKEEVESITPYIFNYENTSNEKTNAVLLGFNDNFGSKNFGNADAIEIKNISSPKTIKKIAMLKYIKIKSKNIENLKQKITVHEVDEKEIETSNILNINTTEIFFEENEHVINIECFGLPLDGNTYITLTVEAKSNMTFYLYAKN